MTKTSRMCQVGNKNHGCTRWFRVYVSNIVADNIRRKLYDVVSEELHTRIVNDCRGDVYTYVDLDSECSTVFKRVYAPKLDRFEGRREKYENALECFKDSIIEGLDGEVVEVDEI